METGGCCFPDDRLYDSEATIWVQLHANSFTIGLTQLQAFAVGKVNSIQPKPVGSNLEAGRSIGFIETVSYSGNARTPLGGVVEEVNAEVVENPAMINADPYGRGWIARLSAQNLGTERVLLSTPDNAAKVAAKLIRDRGLRCFSVYPTYRVSGIGGDCPETLKNLGDILDTAAREDAALLVTDNPLAEKDIPLWVSVHGYRILERRFEEPLKYYVIGKGNDSRSAQVLHSTA